MLSHTESDLNIRVDGSHVDTKRRDRVAYTVKLHRLGSSSTSLQSWQRTEALPLRTLP